MNFNRLNPFARILIPFILGIAIANLALFSVFSLVLTVSVTLLSLITSHVLSKKIGKEWIRILYGFLVSFLFFILGILHFQSTKNVGDRCIVRVKSEIGKSEIKLFRVLSTPIKTKNSCKSEVEWILPESGNLIKGIVYFKDSNHLPFKNQVIKVQNDLKLFEEPKNLGQFNFAEYANGNDWYFSVFVDQWTPVAWEQEFNLSSWFSDLREYLLSIVALYLNGDEYSICSALVFGDKASLSPEIKDAYSGAGAMHVLAVSGLHVGLVYLFLKFILSFLNRTRKTRILKILLIILLIFIYAGITGFSPSVTRAAFMFSLIALGGLFRRSASIYNIIFVSAFVMLLFDPRLLFSVSFQLSYIAVIGIIFLYPRLFLLWDPKTWLTYNIWSLACLSVAAQISTFALALYYFKIFPTWFLLTNLVVVPGAMLELGGGFLLVFSHFIGLGNTVGMVYENLIWGINQAVLFIDSLPPGSLNIGFNGLQMCMTYLLLGLCFLLLEYPSKRKLQGVGVGVILLLLSFIYDDFITQKQKGFLVYDSKNLILEMYSGNKSIIYTNTLSKGFDNDFRYIIQPSLESRNVKNIEIKQLNLKDRLAVKAQVDNQLFVVPLTGKYKNEESKELVDSTLYIVPSSYNSRYQPYGLQFLSRAKYWDIRENGIYMRYF